MIAIEQSFPVVLFTILCKVVLSFNSLDEVLIHVYSNQSYWAVLSYGARYFSLYPLTLSPNRDQHQISLHFISRL